MQSHCTATLTGTEALFADLAHFSRPAIQLSCIGLVFPALTLTYLGQVRPLLEFWDPSLLHHCYDFPPLLRFPTTAMISHHCYDFPPLLRFPTTAMIFHHSYDFPPATLSQGAYLAANPHHAGSLYWHSVPAPLYWPMLLLATLATITASQALISAVFSVVRVPLLARRC